MRASVVVPTYRRPELLDRCLPALVAQEFDRAGYEIIVADDAASLETEQQVAGWARRSGQAIRYVAVTGPHGPAAARNAGWRTASAPIVAFTDDDCIPDRGWLAAGVAAFEDPAVVAASGRVIVPLGRQPTDYEKDAAGLERAEFVTANCFCRRDSLERIGGFDERFTSAWREDSDLQFRLISSGAGKVLGVSQAVVVHPVRPARWGISVVQQSKACFDALLYKKHPRLFRSRIRKTPPWNYYVIVLALLTTGTGLASGRLLVGAGGALVWSGLTAEFCLRRLSGTSRTPEHVAEMVVTSVLIPPLSVFWRLYGAWKFRVLYF